MINFTKKIKLNLDFIMSLKILEIGNSLRKNNKIIADAIWLEFLEKIVRYNKILNIK